ncbi:MAG: hypothetical protein ACREUQ_01920, partial [Burkholderiales bacterium]
TSYLHYRRAPAPHDRPSPFDASGTISVIDAASNMIIATRLSQALPAAVGLLRAISLRAVRARYNRCRY